MPEPSFLRRILENLLEVSIELEMNAVQRQLEKQLKNLNKQLVSQESDAKAACAQLGLNIKDLQNALDQREIMLKNRDARIIELEHEVEILKQDLRGMASVNARSLKWIECIRTAEEKDLLSSNLEQQLAAVQDTNPWQTTS